MIKNQEAFSPLATVITGLGTDNDNCTTTPIVTKQSTFSQSGQYTECGPTQITHFYTHINSLGFGVAAIIAITITLILALILRK